MNIVVTGAGIIGLSTSLLLAKDGHQVTVVERDAQPAPEPLSAWDEWERRGVTQARLPHLFAPRFRTLLRAEMPELLSALIDQGALEWNLFDQARQQLGAEARPDDEDLNSITGRRVVIESVFARAADDCANLEVRRGSAVQALLGVRSDQSVPRVTGIRLDSGEEIGADLVVDATGRRTPIAGWLDDLGAGAPAVEADDSGFVYYGRHFQSPNGSMPELSGRLALREFGSISTLTLPGDNGTWSVVIVGSSADKELRGLRDVDRWSTVMRSLPGGEEWIDGRPLEDRVVSMSKIEDRIQTLVIEGEPVVTGVLLVGDSWACTNPSVGRGASIGLLHAVTLRDTLRSHGGQSPTALAVEWDRVTREVVGPWFDATLTGDRARLAEIEHAIRGEAYAPEDPGFQITKALVFAADQDVSCARALLRIAGVVDTPDEALNAPGVFDAVLTIGAAWSEEPPVSPSRDELVALVNA